MSPRRVVVAANWKMNLRREEARQSQAAQSQTSDPEKGPTAQTFVDNGKHGPVSVSIYGLGGPPQAWDS